jgi:hypothetical protein
VLHGHGADNGGSAGDAVMQREAHRQLSVARAADHTILPSEHMQGVSARVPAAVRLYDAALWSYTGLSGDPVDLLARCLSADPTLVSAHILRAAVYMLSTAVDAEDATMVASMQAMRVAVAEGRVTGRERQLVRACEALAAGTWGHAAGILEAVVAASPCDLLSIRLAHDIYFFLGDARNLRDGPARAWGAWEPRMPGYGRVAGMLAFGHEECGAYAAAEDMAMSALAKDPADVWALHAAVHVHEMSGRREEGRQLLKETAEAWGAANLFDCHLHWHVALMALEDGGVGYRAARMIYVDAVGAPSREDLLNLLDAASLLWRMELLHGAYDVPLPRGTHSVRLHPVLPPLGAPPPHGDAVDPAHAASYVGGGQPGEVNEKEKEAPSSFFSLFSRSDSAAPPAAKEASAAAPPTLSPITGPSRWEDLATRCAPFLRLNGRRLNAFNDAHLTMALAWAARASSTRGDAAAAEGHARALSSLLTSMARAGAAGDPAPDNDSICAEVGLPLARGLAAFVARDYDGAVTALTSTRASWWRLGGSLAQRDVFEQTLLHAAVGSGRLPLALSLAREKTVVRPSSAQAWHVLGEILLWAATVVREGSREEADAAAEAAGAGGGSVPWSDIASRAVEAQNRAYVLGLNQGSTY